jgi:hypothetical protein
MATEKKVEIFIPRSSDREDPNLFVGLNGVNYLLPRGKKSMVPKAVAEELERSNLATLQFYDTADKLKGIKEDK